MSQLQLLEVERLPHRPSGWRMPVLLVRDDRGRFCRRPMPPMPDLGLTHADLESVLGGRHPRPLGERQLWVALWWGDRRAAHQIMELNIPLVDYMIVEVAGRGIADELRREARVQLMADLVRIIERHVPLSGHVQPWMIYKLKYSAINFFSRTRDREDRQRRTAEALASSMPATEAYESTDLSAEAMDARLVLGRLQEIAAGNELPESSWLALNLMMLGADVQDIRRHTGWTRSRVEAVILQMRGELAALGVMDGL